MGISPAKILRCCRGETKGSRVHLESADLPICESHHLRNSCRGEFIEAISMNHPRRDRTVSAQSVEHLGRESSIGNPNELVSNPSRISHRAEQVKHRRHPDLTPRRPRIFKGGVIARSQAKSDAGPFDTCRHALWPEVNRNSEGFENICGSAL
jgi:hypothetical protein